MVFLQDPFLYYALLSRDHPQSPQNSGYKFLATDYQGSIWAVMDQSGQVIEEMGYDPWGNRRDMSNNTPQYTPGPAGNQLFSGLLFRGYTFHEHLDVFGLIIMNGRVYDPQLGRMLSPDNFVQDPSSTQNFNRYSYVLNNPLKYTDPSGEVAIIDDIIVAAVSFTFGYVSHGISTGDWGWSAVGAGAISMGLGLAGYYTGGAACIYR